MESIAKGQFLKGITFHNDRWMLNLLGANEPNRLKKALTWVRYPPYSTRIVKLTCAGLDALTRTQSNGEHQALADMTQFTHTRMITLDRVSSFYIFQVRSPR